MSDVDIKLLLITSYIVGVIIFLFNFMNQNNIITFKKPKNQDLVEIMETNAFKVLICVGFSLL